MNEVKFKANKNDFDSFVGVAIEEFNDLNARPILPTPTADDDGLVPTVNVDSSGETPVITYGLGKVDPSIKKGSVPSSGTRTFDIDANFRALMITNGAHADQRGAFVVMRTNSGWASTTIKAASDLTFSLDTDTNVLTVSNSYASAAAHIMWIVMNGDITYHSET